MNELQGKKILTIDDDPTIRFLASNVLSREGCIVSEARDGEEGMRQFYAVRPDLVVLDINMPHMNGWQVLNNIRQLSQEIPVLMLTSQDCDDDIVHGLERGADDYLTKPFNPKILIARLRVALRHTQQEAPTEVSSGFRDDYLTVDLKEHHVRVMGEEIRLSAKEFGTLGYLVQNAGRVLTARQILEQVWGWEYQDSLDYVRVYITHLRQKLEPDPKNPRYILTEYGTGYRFAKPVP